MHILMMTNTFSPHVGGVARSVSSFADAFRAWGHRVLVVAPEFENTPEHELDVLRVPAIQKFNGSDFSVRLPVPGLLSAALDEFAADIVHAHHPFLLGDTALRVASLRKLPLVFTHHTMYEQYTHYVPVDSPALARFVKELSTGYANLCDQVIAPSESVRDILLERRVTTPVAVIPTGVDVKQFAHGDGRSVRAEHGIPARAFVVGHTGRLAPEKNLHFLAEAVAEFLSERRQAHFLVVGAGPSEPDIRQVFQLRGLGDRLHLAGCLSGKRLVNAYHAMDVFAFASQSETQGMVLAEALAAGVPLVALDAPGVREVVRDESNGRLVHAASISEFAVGLDWVAQRRGLPRRSLRRTARRTAGAFAMERCAERALVVYGEVMQRERIERDGEDSLWSSTVRFIGTEWELWANFARAAGVALAGARAEQGAEEA